MRIIDVNILVYATNRDAPLHSRAKEWLNGVMSGEGSIALPWIVLVGFLRLTTNRRAMPSPLGTEEALALIDAWVSQPNVTLLAPGEQHWRILRELIRESGTAGNLTTDAHLAALAIEHRAELCSADGDFARFKALRWTNPLAGRFDP